MKTHLANNVQSDAIQRIGLLGGTFDPIHIGHLILAEEARYQLNLDCVYLVPAGDPPHKQGRQITSAVHRVRMAELATSDVEHIQVSQIDVERQGPHYTVDTLKIFQQELKIPTEIYFLIGADGLRDLHTWHQPEWLLEHCNLIAFERHDVELDWNRLEERFPDIQNQVRVFNMPTLEIASHTIRDRIRANRPIRFQVLKSVEMYIRQHNLYQE